MGINLYEEKVHPHSCRSSLHVNTACGLAYAGKGQKENTTPFGINLMRSPVLHRAAEVVHAA